MSNIAKVCEISNIEVEVSDRNIELRNIILDLIKFDTDELEIAKVIYFNKKDCSTPDTWFSVVVDGLGITKTHEKTKFNVEVVAANYSEKLQKYEITKYNIKNIKGISIAAYCFNNFKEVNFADVVRINATTASKLGKEYTISCVFVRNNL